jgi:TRAP-type C4-dicarboxylate transport system substrate-binding protein
MKTTFKPLLAALCLSTVSLLSVSAVNAQTIKAADVHPEGYPNIVAVQNMGEKLKQQTDGKLEIKVFPGGVLGDEKQMIEQAQMGAIDMIRVSMAPSPPFSRILKCSPCHTYSVMKTICTRLSMAISVNRLAIS